MPLVSPTRMRFIAKSPKNLPCFCKLLARYCPFATSLITESKILPFARERVCLRIKWRHSKIGTPALTKKERRLAKSVCSLTEKRIKVILFIDSAQNFRNGSQPRTRLSETVSKHGGHAVFGGNILDNGRGRFRH